MRDLRRSRVPGGSYFLTLVTYNRQPLLAGAERVGILRDAVSGVIAKVPFQIDSAVVLPDHMHMIVTLPSDDVDYSKRVGLIKVSFTKAIGGAARNRRLESAVWQHRFWEHYVRDDREFEGLADYVHYNPVKHGYVKCPHAWQWSSFSRWVDRGWREPDWAFTCNRPNKPPDCDRFAEVCGE